MITFFKVILHNFGSYNHAEIDLQNKGFCLVKGENYHKKDNATSNGSGKSQIWSGICFALTGETIQGLHTNLKNIYNDEDEAYVSLDFAVNSDHYFINRIIAPKSDLKIIKNDIDVSGKGILESKAKLEELLPDINQNLIASTIILGQGLPNKFSSFKPSGRKELLEHLTKSDFMIEDIKSRITARASILNDQLRSLDDKLLITKTTISAYTQNLSIAKDKYSHMIKPDFDCEIEAINKHISAVSNDIKEASDKLAIAEREVENFSAALLTKTNEKSLQTHSLFEAYTKKTADIKAKKIALETTLRAAEAKLRIFNDNPGICPTCGQKLPNADHILKEKAAIDTEIKSTKEALAVINCDIEKADNLNIEYTNKLRDTFDADINSLNIKLLEARKEVTRLKNNLTDYTHYSDIDKEKLITLTNQKDSWDREQANTLKAIKDLELTIDKLTNELADCDNAKTTLNEHIQRVKWLDTLTKRDFRGFILADIIGYLDKKAKYYAEKVFGHTELSIYLDGNDLNISYNNKMFDNLSGGEKTKVDLIIQLAIRSLLITYLNMDCNILILDEVTDFLDAKSCDAIMSLIEQELNTIESVFIISHHAETLNIQVDSVLKVTKDETGISSIAAII